MDKVKNDINYLYNSLYHGRGTEVGGNIIPFIQKTCQQIGNNMNQITLNIINSNMNQDEKSELVSNIFNSNLFKDIQELISMSYIFDKMG